MKKFTREYYSGRGAKRVRSLLFEADLNIHCQVCGKLLLRKKYQNGVSETYARFIKRKTCGMEVVDGKLIRSACFQKYWRGETNPNYRHGPSHCVVCGAKLKHLYSAEERRKCQNCYLTSDKLLTMLKNNGHTTSNKLKRNRLGQFKG